MFEQHRSKNEEWLDTQQKELDEARRKNAAEKVCKQGM